MITQQEWSRQMLHRVRVAHKWGTNELGPMCLSKQETFPWAGLQADHNPKAVCTRTSLASWLGMHMLTRVDKRESIKGAPVFARFSNLCQKNIYITQDASNSKQSKQNHTHAVRVSSTGRHTGKEGGFNITYCKESWDSFEIQYLKNNIQENQTLWIWNP